MLDRTSGFRVVRRRRPRRSRTDDRRTSATNDPRRAPPTVARPPLRHTPRTDTFQRIGPAQQTRKLFAARLGPSETTAISSTAGPAPPDVREAVESVHDIRDPYQKGLAIERYLLNADEQWRAEFLRAVGSEEISTALEALDPTPNGGQASSTYDLQRSTWILAEAGRALSPDQLAQVLEDVGPDTAAAIVEYGLVNAENRFFFGNQDLDDNLASFAHGLGSMADTLAPDHPILAAIVDPLMTMPTHEFVGGDQSRAEMAAWLIARSESDTLKSSFVNTYLPEFDPSGADAPDRARAFAMVMGSMDPPSTSLKPLVELDAESRQAFLRSLMAPGNDSLAAISTYAFEMDWGIHRDIHQDVTEFLTDIARLNPVTFKGRETDAALLRVEAFTEATKALDNGLWQGEQPIKDALAHMFNADASTILTQLRYSDSEGRVLSKFFDHVAFRNDGATAGPVLNALANYLGIGDERDGVVDWLVASQARQELLPGDRDLLELATELGFVLGSFHQGAHSALASIQNDYDRQLAVIKALGGLLGGAIERVPGVGDAYQLIKSGSGDKADVETVFTWLYETYRGPGVKSDKDAVAALSDAFLLEAMQPLRDMRGTDLQQWAALMMAINAGVGSGDGAVQPTFRLGG